MLSFRETVFVQHASVEYYFSKSERSMQAIGVASVMRTRSICRQSSTVIMTVKLITIHPVDLFDLRR